MKDYSTTNDLKLALLKNMICIFFEELEKMEKLQNADYKDIKIHETLEQIMFMDLNKFDNIGYKDSVINSVTNKLEYMLKMLENLT